MGEAGEGGRVCVCERKTDRQTDTKYISVVAVCVAEVSKRSASRNAFMCQKGPIHMKYI